MIAARRTIRGRGSEEGGSPTLLINADRGGPTSNATPRPSQSKSAHTSAAIPAAVSVTLFLLLSVFAWRFIVYLRRPRRSTPLLLAKLGFAQKPQLYEVRLASPSVSEGKPESWEKMRPLAVTPLSNGDEKRLSPPLWASGHPLQIAVLIAMPAQRTARVIGAAVDAARSSEIVSIGVANARLDTGVPY